MRILHITDIHGDVEALEKIVKYAVHTEPDVLACTGDYLGFLLSKRQVRDMQEAFRTIRQGIKPGISMNDEGFDKLMKRSKTPRGLKKAVETFRGIEKAFDDKAEKQYSEMAGVLSNFKGTFLSVPGNWDTIKYFENEFFRNGHLHGRNLAVNDIKFTGVGFSGDSPIFTPPTRYIHVGETELYHRLMAEESKADIVLTHTPPYGLQDRVWIGENRTANAGSFAHLAYIRARHPSLVLCGHLHDNLGPTKDSSSGTIVVNSGNLGEYQGSVKKGTFSEIELDDEKRVNVYRGFQIKNRRIEEVAKLAID